MSAELYDCVTLPCRCGTTYFRRSAVTAILPHRDDACLVQLAGETENDHATVLLPAAEVAALVFGFPNHLPSDSANGVVGTDAEAPTRCAG